MAASARAGLRITGGVWRGRHIAAEPQSRPTSDQVREALFSIWQSKVPGCRLLELFSGSGVVGLEAMSRGAASVVFVDRSTSALRLVEQNCNALAVKNWECHRLELPADLRGLTKREPFELVFADPPYRFSRYDELVRDVAPVLGANGEFVVEHSVRRSLPEEEGGLHLADARRYGDSCLSFFRLT